MNILIPDYRCIQNMLCLHIHNDILLIMHVVFDLGSKIEIICVFYGLQLIDILLF